MLRRWRRNRNQINIVPLVDVLIVLIFFFIMSMQFRNRNVLNITPPPIETAGQNKDAGSIQIAVNAEGKMFYNGPNEVTDVQLQELLRVAASIDSSQPILILADEETALRNATFIMDQARKVGLDNIRLQSR